MCELIWQSEKLTSRSSLGSYVDSKPGQLGSCAPSYHRDGNLTQTSTLTPTSRQGDMNPHACLLDIHGRCYIETWIMNFLAWIPRGRRSRLGTLRVSQLRYCLFSWGCLLTLRRTTAPREPFRTAIVLEPSAEPQFPLSLKGSIVSIRKEGKLIKPRSRHTLRVRKPPVNSREHQEHI